MMEPAMSRILSVATAVPDYRHDRRDFEKFMNNWLATQPDTLRKMTGRIIRNTGIEQRHSVAPLETITARLTFEERNDLYRSHIVDLGETVLREALAQAERDPGEIDCIITTSCTGYMIPSFDAYLVNRLGMKRTVQRLPVTEMGCAGGTAALVYAENYLAKYPDANVALICAELSSLSFQPHDLSVPNIVSTSIFTDGVACALLGPGEGCRPRVVDTGMIHFYDETELLGFNLTNSGFRMVLDERLPAFISEHLPEILNELPGRHGLTLNDIQHLIMHPGGNKILNLAEDYLSGYGITLSESRGVLRDYGNMSSATVLFILQRLMEKGCNPGDRALMVSFGPGFMAHTVLLEWAA